MKLVIQIPALNEEEALPRAIAALPRSVAGFSEVAILVIDDGSTDRTADVARAAGADRVVSFAAHRGLATAFRTGLEEALAMGADVVVNFDADLQYDAGDLPALIAPILADRADMVVGDRSPGPWPTSRRPSASCSGSEAGWSDRFPAWRSTTRPRGCARSRGRRPAA